MLTKKKRLITQKKKRMQFTDIKKEDKRKPIWIGKLINLEMSKSLRFDDAYRWYMHKPETIKEKERHNSHWDINTQTDPVI